MENSQTETKWRWKDEVHLLHDYPKYRIEDINMLLEFESMWDAPLDSVDAAQPRIELSPEDTRSVHYAAYRTRTRACKSRKNEIANMLALEVIEPAQTEWASPIVFALKKDQRPPLLCRQQKTQRSNRAHFLSHPTYRVLHWLAVRCDEILDAGH